jgi:hypothetical protein
LSQDIDICFADRRQHPVHLPDQLEDGSFDRSIDFTDYQRMSTVTKAPTYRHKPIPEYAFDQNKMRRLLVQFMEERAFSKKQRDAGLPGTDAVRLQRAQEKLLTKRPQMIAVLDRLCREYVVLKTSASEPESWTADRKERLEALAIEIEGVDTTLRQQEENFPAIVVGVIYRSYCLSEDSVTVAKALNMKPPAVRQLLSRLGQTWRRMNAEESTESGRLRKTPLNRLLKAREHSAKD